MIHYKESDERETVRIGSCGGNFTAVQGTVTSPSFPYEYPGDQNCIYSIVLPTNTFIILRLYLFDVRCYQDDGSGAVSSDYLELWEGSHPAKWCGQKNDIPEFLHLAQNHVSIRLALKKIFLKRI